VKPFLRDKHCISYPIVTGVATFPFLSKLSFEMLKKPEIPQGAKDIAFYY
jgi:hypothetical protein